MFSLTHLIILAGCVLIFAMRAYKKGIWLAAIGLIGFICAYTASTLATAPLIELTKDKGLQGMLALIVSLIAIFFVVSAFVSYVPTIYFPSLKKATSKQRALGMLFGASMGAIVAIGLIWLVGLLSAFSSNQQPQHSEPDLLGKFSSRIVAFIVRTGMSFSDTDEFKKNMVAAAISEPKAFSSAIKEVSTTDELKSFWRNADAQELMTQGDVDGLMNDESFIALIEQPAMKRILAKTLPKGLPVQDNQRYIASQMSFFWQRMDSLRTDERVIDILNDPEVKVLVEKQNTAALLTNKKIQSLISIVMEEDKKNSIDGHKSTSDTSSKSSIQQTAQQSTDTEVKTIYKWRDENGKTRYTDWSHTPEDKRATAEKIVHQ